MNLKTSNAFALLEKKKVTKRIKKEQGSEGGSASLEPQPSVEELEKQLFGDGQGQVQRVSSWADDEEDDWHRPSQGVSGDLATHYESQHEEYEEEEIDLEAELGIELTKDDNEEEEEEQQEDKSPEQERLKEEASSSQASKLQQEAAEQLSKKEKKKKEMEDLDSLLAEFGVDTGTGERGEEAEKAKKKKKKGKAKLGEEQEGQLNGAEPVQQDVEVNGQQVGEGNAQEEEEEPIEVVDPAKVKAMLASKQKKSAKSSSATARAAAEAKARAQKKGKSKDAKKFNQQPVR